MGKPVILTLARYYLPGFRSGGPIRSLANLVDALHSDFDFRIVALDRDVGDKRPYAGTSGGEWVTIGNAQVCYLRPGLRAFASIPRILASRSYDVLYLNSFFDPVFTLWPLILRQLSVARPTPLVIAPRGEFSSGALQIKKWKKSPFLTTIRRTAFYSGAIWQASSKLEEAQIIQALSEEIESRVTVAGDVLSTPSDDHGIAVVVAPNVAERGDALVRSAERSHARGALKVCFLSRISPMKNLTYALTVLGQVRVPVEFNIFGPREVEGYWLECVELIRQLPAHVRATYRGPVERSDVVQTFADHDVFLFPTLGENFGHVIHESLRAGTPVLISDRTPWKDVESCGIGVAIPLDEPVRFVQAIEDIARWDDKKRAAVRAAAQNYARSPKLFSDPVEANRDLFRQALASH